MSKITKVYLDNGGGATLHIDGYIHYYGNMDQLSRDIHSYWVTGSCAGWEGNESELIDMVGCISLDIMSPLFFHTLYRTAGSNACALWDSLLEFQGGGS
jgi:hypothetical protein